MQDQVLLKVTIVTDDETGVWNIGDLDFGILGTCYQYIEKKPENRERLADWLQMLADRCRNSQPPFGPEKRRKSVQL
jgi:hypothetical protein